MKILSLFDGISCGQVALERANIPVEVYYASEIDKYAIQVTQKNYPDTIQLGDVEKVDFTQFEGKIDLLIGGSPCTNLSIAGNRKGLEGDESRLFWEYVRAIKECKPKYFLLENVESMGDKDKEIISNELGCYPIMINSSLVSAQNRKRYYWFNWGDKQYNLFGFPTCDIPQPKDKGILLKDVLESGIADREKTGALCATDYKGFEYNAIEYMSKHQRCSYVAEPVIYQLSRGYNDGGIKKDKSPALTTSQWQYNNLLADIADKNNGEMPKMFSIYNKQVVKDKSPTVTANSNVSLTHCGSVGIFSPIRLSEHEKSQGQAQRVYSVRGESVALNANGGGQGGKTGLYKIDLPDGDYIIRKLTPIECERLQTLPDNYTEYGTEGKISNTQRYKAIGNGWTVDVIAYIFSFINCSAKATT